MVPEGTVHAHLYILMIKKGQGPTLSTNSQLGRKDTHVNK